MSRVGISLGSNLGDRLAYLRSAIERLSPVRSSEHLLLSSIFETDPVDCPPDSEPFYNAVIEIETELEPLALLRVTQEIERALGRPEREERALNAPRTIDLDLLYYSDQTIETKELILPHPRMALRGFVLLPLQEIRPDLVPESSETLLNDAGVRRTSLSLPPPEIYSSPIASLLDE